MTAVAKIEEVRPRSVTVAMADRYGMEPAAFEQTLRATVVPGSCSKEQFAAFLLVAKEYRLNPLTKEIYAFPGKGGGIQPIVSIDGWARIINERPELTGIEFDDHLVEGKLEAITCKIHRRDRDMPICVTEYMSECRRATDTWKQWPARMLRHKSLIQCARYAFGFSGIVDPDEFERMHDVTTGRHVERPDIKARLPGPGKLGGFQASNVDAAFDAETGEIIEGEVVDLNVDAPADDGLPVRDETPTEETTEATDPAEPAEDLLQAVAGAFDVIAWADNMERNLPDYAGVEVMRLDWNDHKAELQQRDAERFKRLNFKIAQRAEEIAKAKAQR